MSIFMPKLEGNLLFDRLTKGKLEQTDSFFKDILAASLEGIEVVTDAEPVKPIDSLLEAIIHAEQLLHEHPPNELGENKAKFIQDIERLLIQLNEMIESNMLHEEYISEELVSELASANKIDKQIVILLEKIIDSQKTQFGDELPVSENGELGKSIVYLHQLPSLQSRDMRKQLTTDRMPISDQNTQQMERTAAMIFQSKIGKPDDMTYSRGGRQHKANQLVLKFSGEQSEIEIQNRPIQEAVPDLKSIAARAEPYMIRLSVNNGQGLHIREFAKEFENILQRSHFSQLPHAKKLTIRLYPEHLGSLRIELVQREGMMLARILASSNMTKELLENHIHQLRHAFSQQNIQMDKVEIIHNHEFLKYSQNEEQQNQDHSQHKEKQKGRRQMDDQNEADFSQVLNDLLFESEA